MTSKIQFAFQSLPRRTYSRALNRTSLPRKLGWSEAAAVLLLSSLLFVPKPAWSQVRRPTRPQPEEKLTQPRVNVGVSAAKPDDIIDIPLTLGTPEGVKVGSVIQTINFPKKILEFTKAELGLAGEQSEAEIKSDLKNDSGNPDLSLLVVSISSKAFLKPGILAYLKFKVSDDAKKGQVILKIVDSKISSPSGEPLQAAHGKDGEISLFNKDEEIPIVGCFFFTH